uniref:Carboxypeptidase regulatory-like domain-containing protein n=1 Tax=Dechloromonas aromatica (strain RCB) TaxID=159087 RepID=Q47EA4_DECAR
MTNLAAVSVGKAQTRHGRLGVIAMVLALQCLPALAVDVDDAAKSNVASSTQAEVSWISGGVGDEAMTEMHKVAAAYNVHVMMTGVLGNYLAGVPFTVSRRNGQMKVSGATEGPLLYLKLPAGSYQIAVEINGASQTRRIQVSASGPATKVRFVAKSE